MTAHAAMVLYFMLIAGTLPRGASAADAASAAASASVEPAYIEEARVFFPKSPASWRLQSTLIYDDAASGVRARYGSDKFPGVVVDVFVYPAGLMSVADALDVAAIAFVADIQDDEKAGNYAAITRPSYEDFELERDEEFDPVRGRRYQFDFQQGNDAIAMRAVLMHRYLHFIKLRVAGPRAQADAIDAATDDVIAAMALEVRVVNRGACAGHGRTQMVHVDAVPDDDPISLDGSRVYIKYREAPESLKEELAASEAFSLLIRRAVNRRKDQGCVGEFDRKYGGRRMGEQVETLRYTGEFWDGVGLRGKS